MGVNSLPKTVTRQRRGCDLNPGPSAPKSSTDSALGYRANPIIIAVHIIAQFNLPRTDEIYKDLVNCIPGSAIQPTLLTVFLFAAKHSTADAFPL